jgi:hypothetical protein
MTCLASVASAQGQPQPNTATVGFHNKSDFNVIVKGYTIVNGSQRAGALIQVKKGFTAYELGVPLGIRYYTVYDASNPQARMLLQDHPAVIRAPMVQLNILPAPGNPNRVVIVPVGGQ